MDDPCTQCGGWTHNEDGHRNDCPKRAKPERSSDSIMLLVWEQWAKREGNHGAAELFRHAADALVELDRLRAALSTPTPPTP